MCTDAAVSVISNNATAICISHSASCLCARTVSEPVLGRKNTTSNTCRGRCHMCKYGIHVSKYGLPLHKLQWLLYCALQWHLCWSWACRPFFFSYIHQYTSSKTTTSAASQYYALFTVFKYSMSFYGLFCCKITSVDMYKALASDYVFCFKVIVTKFIFLLLFAKRVHNLHQEEVVLSLFGMMTPLCTK